VEKKKRKKQERILDLGADRQNTRKAGEGDVQDHRPEGFVKEKLKAPPTKVKEL